MFETILNDVIGAVTGVFDGASPIQLGILAIVALLSAGTMNNLGQLVGRSGLSVIFLGLVNMIYAGATSGTPGDMSMWMGQIQGAWNTVMSITGGDLLGLFATFLVANGVIFGGKSLLVRS